MTKEEPWYTNHGKTSGEQLGKVIAWLVPCEMSVEGVALSVRCNTEEGGRSREVEKQFTFI